MITSKLEGGLGNQMFQYAAAYSLSIDKNCDIDLDLSWFTVQKATTQRPFELGIFGIRSKSLDIKKTDYSFINKSMFRLKDYLTTRTQQVVDEPYFHYWPDFHKIKPKSKLNGYWQSEKYFLHNRTNILRTFTFPEIVEERNLKYLSDIKSIPNSVSLHVRRGDYISDPNTNTYHGCCSIKYYEEAVRFLDTKYDNNHYFIFSDDPEWVSSTFKLKNMTIITGNDGASSYRDMQLMSTCKHHIIANSSFSWWGAWISSQEGFTIAPKKWILDPNVNTEDIYAETWVVI